MKCEDNFLLLKSLGKPIEGISPLKVIAFSDELWFLKIYINYIS